MPTSRNRHRPEGAQAIAAADYPALATEEAHVLATLKGYAEAFGGFSRHIRQARGQDLVGLPDALLWVPTHARAHELLAAIEIKIRDDDVTCAQARVMEAMHRIDRIVAEVVRVGARPREGEIGLDDLLTRLDDARGWT